MHKTILDKWIDHYFSLVEANPKLDVSHQNVINHVCAKMGADGIRHWLWENREAIIRQRVSAASRARHRTVRRKAAAAFAEALGSDGPSEIMLAQLKSEAFGLWHKVDRPEGPTFVRAGDMTGSDHSRIAERYENQGNRMMLLASFHRKVAAKVGDSTVGETYGAEEYLRMLASIDPSVDLLDDSETNTTGE